MALLAAAAYGDVETFPVVHNETIIVRVLGSKDGRPLKRLHLVMIGGYDRKDMHDQLFRSEVLTDAHGRVRLPNQLANLPWLQVWVNKKTLCQGNPRKSSFSVELIRRDGLSTPNRCGMATVEDAPGVFTVFVKGKGDAAAAIEPAARPVVLAPVVVAAGSCDSTMKSSRCVAACEHLGAAASDVVRVFRKRHDRMDLPTEAVKK